jgi:hypothetical protein
MRHLGNKRRNLHDPLEPSKEPRYVEILDKHSQLLEGRTIEPGADLKRIFAATLIEFIDSGWTVTNFSSTSGAFFCTKEHDRRQVAIVQVKPGTDPGFGLAHLTRSPGTPGME